MEREHVNSSNLESVGYDPETKTLEIAFLNRGIYQYSGIPVSVYQGLMSAPPHGQYFDQYIKKGGYTYRKIR